VTAKNPANNNNSSIAAATFISIKGVFCFGIFFVLFFGGREQGECSGKIVEF